MSTLAAIGAALAVLAMLIGWAACCMSGQCSEVERREADRLRDRKRSGAPGCDLACGDAKHRADRRLARAPISQDELRQLARQLVEHDCSMGNLCDWPGCRPGCPWLRSVTPRPSVEGATGEPPRRRTAGKLPPSRALPCPSPSRLAASVLLLGLSGCSVMERASTQPLCLAFCQITQNEWEGVQNVRRR